MHARNHPEPGNGLVRRIARRLSSWRGEGTRERSLDLVAELNSAYDAQLGGIAEMSDAEWSAFSALAAERCARMAPEDWAGVEVRKKVLLGFSALGRRDRALDFLAADGWERDHFAGTVTAGTVIAEVPLAEVIREELGPHMLEFSPEELFMDAVLRSVSVTEAGVDLELFTHVNHLRMDTAALTLSCALIGAAGDAVPVPIERTLDARAAPGYTRRYADMAAGAARAHVAADLLGVPGDFELRLTIESSGLTRERTLTIDASTVLSVAAPLTADLLAAVEGRGGKPARLRVFRPEYRVERIEAAGRRVRVALAASGTGEAPVSCELLPRGVAAERAEPAATAPPRERAAGHWDVELEVPATGQASPREYVLGVRRPDGTVAFPALWDAEVGGGSEIHVAASLHRWGEPSGQTLVVDLAESVLLTDVTMTEQTIRLRVAGPVAAGWTAQAGTAVTPLTVDEVGVVGVDGSRGAESELVFSLREDRWGLGETAVRPGKYVLSRGERSAYLSGELAARFPLRFATARGNLTVARAADGTAVLSVTPPLRAEDVGAGPQLRLQEWSRGLRPPDTGQRSILFRNLFGEHANDSALAVHRELERRGSALERIWCVKDHSVWVPEGARTVLEGSREFYEAWGTAHYVMVNMHQPRWHHKPPGQTIIQTFHGYQFKLQGRRWFAQLGHDQRRTDSLFRRAAEWDYLVSPAASSTGPLRESYRSDDDIPSEFLELGYPRNDVLLSGEAGALRADTRSRLGIPEGKTAILYAPTFRDDRSSDDMTADLVDHLDEERLMRELGPEYVLLMRGHPFNARVGVDAARNVLNVTDYPDINHLILASDAAVLDYSSLRFDYALTGKPMLFYVPDLESYFATRESFWPYEETAPGPLICDEAGLLAGIRDHAAIAVEYESARNCFLADYMEHEDGHATERLIDAVFVPHGDA